MAPMRPLCFALLSLLCACERTSSDASIDPDEATTADGGAASSQAPPADSFEISIINRCAETWRYYVAAAVPEGGGGATASESQVVPKDQYTFVEPGASVSQRLGPGDVIWMVNRKGESTATGFQSRAEGEGGRVEVNPDCETIKRVRLAPAGA